MLSAGIAPGARGAAPPPVRPNVRVTAYRADGVLEPPFTDAVQLRGLLAAWPVTWVDVDGLGDPEVIQTLGEVFNLHPLVLEDIVHVHQRAKAEQYEGHQYIVARMAPAPPASDTEQLSLILGQNFVVTFQEGRPGDPFDPVRERIRTAAGRIRSAGADYLAYCLLDAIVDGYFPVLEEVGERLDTLEDELLDQPARRTFHQIHGAKRELLALRRAVWPLREAFNTLVREPTPLITDETRPYLRDCYDHAVRIIDFVETYRELGSDLMDLYLSSINQRMTEVMKVLTIIATIFIPLTFMSSIYGMNFDPNSSPLNMPELRWYWGYPLALLLMAAVAAGLVGYFWWRGWLSSTLPSGGADERGDGPPA